MKGFILEKGKLQVDLIADFQYIKVAYRKDEKELEAFNTRLDAALVSHFSGW